MLPGFMDAKMNVELESEFNESVMLPEMTSPMIRSDDPWLLSNNVSKHISELASIAECL